MHSNRYWIFFLIAVALVAFGFGANAAWQLRRYFALDAQAPSMELSWTVKSKMGDRYYLLGKSSFQVKETRYSGETLVEKPMFRNLWSANSFIEEIKDQSRLVYYSRVQPQINTLERHFPLKEVLSAAALLVLFLYFLGLGYYVGLRNR